LQQRVDAGELRRNRIDEQMLEIEGELRQARRQRLALREAGVGVGQVHIGAAGQRREAGAAGLDVDAKRAGAGDDHIVALGQQDAGDGENGIEVAGCRRGGKQDTHGYSLKNECGGSVSMRRAGDS
jgi:hypothetical protein